MARTLVIEDHPGMRDVLEETLLAAGHEVCSAANGEEGVALFRTQPADLVITDLLMPQKEGLETIKDLRRRAPDLKIIAISGASPEWRVLDMAKQLGAHTTLSKPFTAQEILGAVTAVLTNI
ncbi:MAG: response regulator [Verrucomicrobia bacterium]|nr:MAG: response regulator [Verrucomicrobiota bacterium]